MKMKTCLTLLSIPALSLIGCGGSNSSPSKSPNEVFTVANNAITSVAVEGLTFARSNPRAYSVTLDPLCGEHGEPLDAAGSQIMQSDPSYAAKFFYCLAKQPTGGEDTLQGAISLPRALSCALDGKLQFNGEPTVISVTIGSDCFADRFTEQNGGGVDLTATVTASKIGEPLFGDKDAWDYSVEIQSDALADAAYIDVKLLFKTGPSLYATAMNSNVNGHVNDASAIYIDVDSGVLRYESKNQRYSESCGSTDCGWNRHNRLLVQGAISDDGTFTSVTNMEGIHGDLYAAAVSGGDTDGFLMLTIKGIPADGLYTHNFQGTGDPMSTSDFSTNVTQCEGGSCTGNTGIAITSTSDLEFLMSNSSPSLTAGADWFDALAPLSFTSVTTADSQ